MMSETSAGEQALDAGKRLIFSYGKRHTKLDLLASIEQQLNEIVEVNEIVEALNNVN